MGVGTITGWKDEIGMGEDRQAHGLAVKRDVEQDGCHRVTRKRLGKTMREEFKKGERVLWYFDLSRAR